ncbi:MAG: hypothetical protein ABJC89_02230 [Acidobacteriota bacterium]
MEQRRLRLGDILDDYCPRERRLTNHVVVAMIEEDVKQTRCTTCDAEHPYKGGKVPKRRKKESPAALYKEVLAGMPDAKATPVLASAVSQPAPETVTSVALIDPPAAPVAPLLAEPADHPPAAIDEIEIEVEAPRGPDVDGPVHRPLIRAQLPRVEGHKEERRLPEFTIRQAGRGNGFRGGDARMKPARPGGHPGNGNGTGNGAGNGGHANRPHGGPRFAGSRPGAPGRSQPGRGGPTAGFRSNQPRPGGGGKKRSR